MRARGSVLAMTAVELDELERLLAKSTPGPWDAHDYAEGGAGDRRYQIQEQSGAHRRGDKAAAVLGYFEDAQVPTPEARANARLVAAMRSALPALVAKVRAADALVRHDAPLIMTPDVLDVGGDTALAEIVADIRKLRDLITTFHERGHSLESYHDVRAHTEETRRRMDAYVNGGHKCHR